MSLETSKARLDHITKYHTSRHAKPVECPICTKTFADNYTLKRHIANKHEKTKHLQCEYCDERFSHIEYLKKHIKVKHPLISSDIITSPRKVKIPIKKESKDDSKKLMRRSKNSPLIEKNMSEQKVEKNSKYDCFVQLGKRVIVRKINKYDCFVQLGKRVDHINPYDDCFVQLGKKVDHNNPNPLSDTTPRTWIYDTLSLTTSSDSEDDSSNFAKTLLSNVETIDSVKTYDKVTLDPVNKEIDPLSLFSDSEENCENYSAKIPSSDTKIIDLPSPSKVKKPPGATPKEKDPSIPFR